ncbi:MAG TPA: sulfatase-like hydrolase/transferase, partial [Verrucomicrobiota bacterium]|nr:sulfatase-like hydrolase/transferase [Verrucomicrobiota bacterium]
MKRIFTIITILLLGFTQAQAKPNVLFIAIDDLNDWIGVLGGHPQAQTPNLDRLAKRATLFTHAYC